MSFFNRHQSETNSSQRENTEAKEMKLLRTLSLIYLWFCPVVSFPVQVGSILGVTIPAVAEFAKVK